MEKELFESFSLSIQRLEEILSQPKTIITRDAAIKRFELTFELVWKVLQKYLGEEGIICNSPKSCFKSAFQTELIIDTPEWLEMIEDRNLTVHTYDEETADDVYHRLATYLYMFKQIQKELVKKQLE
ncbi:MAG: nucleotidyltransferase substrate binding protein [Candidatus Magasanikbacteria bacterium]|nr:nucleotidyltransferase substrate binding protein [Candidatus Magasanikbacteria bacterium]